MGTMMLAVLAAAEVASEGGSVAGGGVGLGAVLLGIIVALLSSSVIANMITAVITGLRASAELRRQHYSTAVELLAARIEYPYRLRRRTNNNPETLAKLADVGHDVQQRLAQSRAWIAAENAVLGDVFDACLTALDEPFKDACREAWDSEPVTEPSQMNLNGFGMGDQRRILASMQCALVYRFGWRRVVPNRKLREILRKKGCPFPPG